MGLTAWCSESIAWGRLLEPLGGIEQSLHRGRPGVGHHDVIELGNQAIQLRAAGKQLDAAVVGRGADGRQDADGVVVSSAARCDQYVAQLAHRGLEQHGRQLGVLGDMRAGTNRSARTAIHQLHRGDGEDVARNYAGSGGAGNGFGVLRFEVDVYEVGLTIGGGVTPSTSPTRTP